MNIVEFIGGVLLSVALLAMLLAVLWSLFDVVVRATDVPVLERVFWVVFLATFSVLAAIVYVRFGPGRSRWAPWEMWWPRRT